MKKLFVLFSLFLLTSLSVDAKTVTFAVASDIHYSVFDNTGSKRDISDAPKALQGFVDRVNENRYDFVVFSGDMIDKSNAKNLNGFLNVVSGIKRTPYYLVMGNHDVHKISGLSKLEYLAAVSKSNKYQKKAKESYTFSPSADILAVVLDGVSSGMPTAHGVFSAQTLLWLDEVLTKNKNKKVIIFQHVPYIEPYSNPSHEILDKSEYKAVLSRHDNVLMVVSGHYHKEGIFIDEKGVYHVSAPSLYQAPFYYDELVIKYDKLPCGEAKNFKLDGTQRPSI